MTATTPPEAANTPAEADSTAWFALSPEDALEKQGVDQAQGLAAADRVFDIVETPSTIEDPIDPHPIETGPHDVRFENVHFSYEDQIVLKGIDLTV